MYSRAGVCVCVCVITHGDRDARIMCVRCTSSFYVLTLSRHHNQFCVCLLIQRCQVEHVELIEHVTRLDHPDYYNS